MKFGELYVPESPKIRSYQEDIRSMLQQVAKMDEMGEDSSLSIFDHSPLKRSIKLNLLINSKLKSKFTVFILAIIYIN